MYQSLLPSSFLHLNPQLSVTMFKNLTGGGKKAVKQVKQVAKKAAPPPKTAKKVVAPVKKAIKSIKKAAPSSARKASTGGKNLGLDKWYGEALLASAMHERTGFCGLLLSWPCPVASLDQLLCTSRW